MNKLEKFGCLLIVIRIVTTVPLYYVLTFLILRQIEASDVMWLLFWLYAPIGVVLVILTEGAKIMLKDEDK